jgi:hypothetical protein
MPAVIVRRRLGRRSLDLSYRLNRWYWRYRAPMALTAAFAVACLIGLGATTIGLRNLFPH